MAFDILITIFFTAIVQSIFGTGVLLFGTPILLILGYNFQYALIILLPTSILINFFQLKNNFNKIDIQFYKRLFLFSIPLIILFLYFTNSNSIRINLFVGIFLVIIALKENILSINRLMKLLIKYEHLYLMIMGIIHGITNLGGALLSGIVFSKDLSKESKRATIAICYLTFAIFQITTLIIIFNNNNIYLINMLTPTTSKSKMKKVAQNSKGFIYYVSSTGVTGSRDKLSSKNLKIIDIIKQTSSIPVLVGFGVSTNEHIKIIDKYADGAIIASALINKLSPIIENKNKNDDIKAIINNFINNLRK